MAVKKKEPKIGNVLGVPSKDIQEYVKFFNKNNLKELSIKERGTTISLKRSDAIEGQPVFMPGMMPAPQVVQPGIPVAVKPASRKVEAPVADDSSEKITSPIIGTYYAAPSPGADPFIKEGQSIKKGATLCIIEAMKVMNKITAEFDCKIKKILVENAQPVKSGEALFTIEK